MVDWDKLRHFKKHEFVGPQKMKESFLLRLDGFRDHIKSPIFISYSTNGTHSENSQHYKGLATDNLFPKWEGSLFGLYLMAEQFNFTGIGVYPDWEYDGKVIGGLHLDSRKLHNYRGARWIGVKKLQKNGKIELEYHGLTAKNLKKYKIIT